MSVPFRRRGGRGGALLATAAVLGVVLGAGLLRPVPAVARRSAATPCTGGRFLFAATDPEAYHRATPPDDTIVVGDGEATLGPTCGAAVATVRTHANATVVRARWRTCGARKRVVLTARIHAPDCTAMSGVVREAGARRRFTATRSTCGDGRFDPVVENCDGGVGCPAGDTCGTDCRCLPPGVSTTTTTTTLPGATTTTLPPAQCTTVEVPFEGGFHVAEGTPITYVHNPPASGNHYPVWARWEDLPDPIARGYWVHNLEHGGIVIVYRPDLIGAAVSVLHAAYAAIPDDPECGHKRSLMTPDPPLDVPFAVVAHDLVMECDRPDVDAIVAFALANRNHSVEDDCRPGLRP